MSDLGAETALRFDCETAALIGVLHRPAGSPSTGVVIVVGGPQYRVGSHRQFVSLARSLAATGIAALRFDCRGMGDSDGEFPGFEAIEPDIAVAVDALQLMLPSIKQIVLWGLCDGASAICLYAQRDARISGVVLLNPWVRMEASHARAQLKHYYLQRLVDPGFLGRLFRGDVNPFRSLSSLFRDLLVAYRGRAATTAGAGNSAGIAFPDRMAAGLKAYRGSTLLILSGRDLTAREFGDVARQSPSWRGVLEDARVTRHELPQADHTFSRREWSEQVAAWTMSWIGEHIRP